MKLNRSHWMSNVSEKESNAPKLHKTTKNWMWQSLGGETDIWVEKYTYKICCIENRRAWYVLINFIQESKNENIYYLFKNGWLRKWWSLTFWGEFTPKGNVQLQCWQIFEKFKNTNSNHQTISNLSTCDREISFSKFVIIITNSGHKYKCYRIH